MYGFHVSLHLSFNKAVDVVTEQLKAKGFAVLTVIDVKTTLKEKIGIDVGPYVILGACNPTLAHQSLSADPDMGLLLPCNVVIRQKPDGEIVVAFLDPQALSNLVNKPEVTQIASVARG